MKTKDTDMNNPGRPLARLTNNDSQPAASARGADTGIGCQETDTRIVRPRCASTPKACPYSIARECPHNGTCGRTEILILNSLLHLKHYQQVGK